MSGLIAGPMPCSGCRELVIYGRRMNRGNPPRRSDTFPEIRDARTLALHRCTGPDARPPEDPMTRRITL